ncbi:hypothetical protein [Clostridium sp.]|uniref:hypothetical protein n=1 Tax=Clostridium sp. TaxID=1506 RepID=UPI002638CF03|nr:hypothetical protein [Clostridium sp.]
MSNVAKIDNFVNRFEKTDTIDNVNNTFVVIPFQVSGMETYTNSGYKEGVRNPNDYETFKQI